MAAQGQADFVAAGDAAAYDASGDVGTTNLSVDNPGDSPYITSAGGTTLPWSATLTVLVVGRNVTASLARHPAARLGLGLPVAAGRDCDRPAGVASRRGTSSASWAAVAASARTSRRRPTNRACRARTVQRRSVPDADRLQQRRTDRRPTAWNFNPTPSVQHGFGSGRAEPDLAADADPETGYLEYSPSFAGEAWNAIPFRVVGAARVSWRRS